MPLIRPAFLLAALLFAATPVFAHDDATLDAATAPHGGQLRMAGIHHFELIVDAKTGSLLVYVTDHAGSKTAVAGATGSATLLSGSIKTALELKPDGDNRMKGVGTYSAAPGVKVIVSITLPGQAAAQARFTPKV
jgi:hypothetical protein